MKTLYDLLGARADDDAEGLRNAFRQAAKANHPDLHAGDPDAAMRFRQIVEAYDILRDAQQRATYDRLLKFERERFRRRLKSTASYLVRNIVSDAIAVVGLAIVLGGGYTLFAYEKDDGVPQLFSSHFAMSDEKADVKMPDAANVSTGNAKIPEMKTSARARTAAKRQAASRAAFAQAAPENRSTCSGSCSGDAPPLFGVGF